jgi:putative ABC transport system permease protein
MWLRSLILLIQRSLLRRERRDRDIDEEIGFHLEQEARLRIERGASPAQARRDALLAFGNPSLSKELTRGVWVSTRLEQLAQDLRLGCRILVTSPALSATAVLLLMLVIGGNTTVFSIANGILKKPAPGVRNDRLVTLNWIQADGFVEPLTSYANYVDVAAQSTAFRPVIAFRPYVRFSLAHDRGTQAANGTLISANYFEAFGVTLARGRTFTRAEHEGAAGLAAIVSHRFWQETLQGRTDVVGLSIALNGAPATIVGVVERGFEGTRIAEAAHVWVPLLGYSRLTGSEPMLWNRADFTIVMGGRLADEVSMAQAIAQTDAIWSRLQTAHAAMDRSKVRLVPYSAAAGSGTGLGDLGDRILALFSVITLMTLVVVCANVANLLLARAVTRQREVAVRQSLGASQWRVLRMLVAEGLLISAIATIAALAGAWWVARLVVHLFPSGGPWSAVAAMDVSPDWRVALYAVLLAMIAVVSFTVAPALRTWRVQVLPWLKAGEQGLVQGRLRSSRVLVVVQLALAVVLLTNAGLVYRSLFLMGSTDPGFEPHQLLSVTVNTSASAPTADANRVLLERIHDRLRSASGVVSVTYSRWPLFRDGGWYHARVRPSRSAVEAVDVQRNHVGPDFFQTLAIRSPVAREFGLRERGGSARGVVISQNLAAALWPGQSPLGRALTVDPGVEWVDGAQANIPSFPAEVVAVSADGFFSRFARTPQRFVFMSAAQDPVPAGDVTFYVRYRDSLDVVARSASASLRAVDPRVATVSLIPMDDVVEGALWPSRTIATLLSFFAGISFTIAAIGQYAVVSFDMRRRTRELGLRMAIGASSRQVLTDVVREGMRLTAIGLALGFLLSLVIGQALGRVLFGVTPTDAVTYAGVFASLTVASLLACWLPARRAARINPITALRYE